MYAPLDGCMLPEMDVCSLRWIYAPRDGYMLP